MFVGLRDETTTDIKDALKKAREESQVMREFRSGYAVMAERALRYMEKGCSYEDLQKYLMAQHAAAQTGQPLAEPNCDTEEAHNPFHGDGADDQLYVAAIWALRKASDDGDVFDQPTSVTSIYRASSSQEALDFATKEARKEWPPFQGWTDHDAKVLPLARNVVIVHKTVLEPLRQIFPGQPTSQRMIESAVNALQVIHNLFPATGNDTRRGGAE